MADEPRLTPMERRKWVERYGEPIVQCGIVPVPQMLITHRGKLRPKLTSHEFEYALNVLVFYWEGGKWPYLSLNKVAAAMGIQPRRAWAIKQSLIGKGYLKCTGRAPNEGYTEDTGRHYKGPGADTHDLTGLLVALEQLVPAELDERERKRPGRAPRYRAPAHFKVVERDPTASGETPKRVVGNDNTFDRERLVGNDHRYREIQIQNP
jgi:hypothetical protein